MKVWASGQAKCAWVNVMCEADEKQPTAPCSTCGAAVHPSCGSTALGSGDKPARNLLACPTHVRVLILLLLLLFNHSPLASPIPSFCKTLVRVGGVDLLSIWQLASVVQQSEGDGRHAAASLPRGLLHGVHS